MNPAPPVTSTLTICLLPSRLAAEGAEEVGERADPGERERQVEPMVLRDHKARRPAEIVGLILDIDAAALRIVEGHDALLPEVCVADVVVERVGAAEVVARIADRRG